jgi:hypothetical protein
MSSIYVTLGKKRYVGGTITELTGKDISTATFTIALGTDSSIPPTVFTAPDVSTIGTTNASRVLKKLIDSSTLPGTYYVWANILDSPEIEPVVLQGPVTVV